MGGFTSARAGARQGVQDIRECMLDFHGFEADSLYVSPSSPCYWRLIRLCPVSFCTKRSSFRPFSVMFGVGVSPPFLTYVLFIFLSFSPLCRARKPYVVSAEADCSGPQFILKPANRFKTVASRSRCLRLITRDDM